MELKIGQAVLVHGYIDEIRTDTVIIRNDGGYFGTVPSEIEAIVQETGAGEMLICPDCGLEVHSDFKTCPRCGCRMIEPQDKNIIWYDKRNYSEIVVKPQESEVNNG